MRPRSPAVQVTLALVTLALVAACTGSDGGGGRAAEPGEPGARGEQEEQEMEHDGDGFLDPATWRERQQAYLDFATEELEPGSILNVVAHVAAGAGPGDLSSVTPESLARPLDKIAGWEDTADFDVLYLLNLLYAGRDRLPEATSEAIEAALVGFKYWYTEPTPAGVVDNRYYWSENHRIIFHVVEYLAGQLFPAAAFTNDGRSGAEHMAEARQRILTWMEEKVRFGFTEWHSDVYYQKDLTPLLSLVEWADDPELAERAAMVLDLFLFDIALHLHAGNLGVTHGRSYMKDKSIATDQDVFGAAKVLFDDADLGFVSRGDPGAVLFARAEKYRLPAVIARVAVSDEPLLDHERMNVPLDPHAPVTDDPAAPYGYDFDDPANVDFWWERGAQTVWQVVPITMATLDEHDLWDSQFFSPFKPLRDAVGGDGTVARQFAASLSRQLAFALLAEVSTTTYRTPHVMLSTALDHRPGDFGDQHHIWQATLSGDAVVFTTHPKNEPFAGADSWPDADGYWTGSGSLPRSAQHGAAAIHLYAPAFASAGDDGGPLSTFTYLDKTHAWFPTERFDEVVVSDRWVFGREGDGYVALWSHRPVSFVDPVPGDIHTGGLSRPFDLVAEGGADNVWVVEVGDADRWGSFEAFREAVGAAEVSVTARTAADGGLPGGFDVAYASPTEGDMAFGQTGPFTVEGREVPLRHDARFANRYAEVPFESRRYEISDGAGSLILDFEAGARTAR